jgi:hypothetical protein
MKQPVLHLDKVNTHGRLSFKIWQVAISIEISCIPITFYDCQPEKEIEIGDVIDVIEL